MTDKPKWTDLFGIDPDYTKDAAEEPKYTESDMRVLTEAALRLGRKEALDEAAAKADWLAEGVANPQKPYNEGFIHGCGVVARHIRELASRPLQDASSARTDLSVDTDLPQESQAVREPPSDPPGPGVGHRRCDCVRGHPIPICAECGEDWPCEGSGA